MELGRVMKAEELSRGYRWYHILVSLIPAEDARGGRREWGLGWRRHWLIRTRMDLHFSPHSERCVAFLAAWQHVKS
jgi:hypothetical protein